MRSASAVLIAIYVVLLAAALLVSYRLAPFDARSGFENFGKIAAVFFAGVSAFMAAVVTIINFDRNAREAAKLALLNEEISKSLAEYKSELDKKLLGEQFIIDKKLERWQTAFSSEMKVYSELSKAANAAYDTLAKLERGEFKEVDRNNLNEAMGKANADTGLLHTQAHIDLWEKFWNYANYIAELAEALKSNDEQPNLWHRQVGKFAEHLSDFQRVVIEKLHEGVHETE